LVIACTFLFACGGAADDPGSAAPGAPGTAAAEAEDAEDLSAAPFCAGSASYDEVHAAVFAALSPDSAADYLALRRNAGGIPSPGLTKELITVSERGALCSGASDLAKCKDAYAALSPPISVSDHHCFTRGDTVGCLESKPEAVAFLGTVDSIEEAVFIAQYEQYYATCSDPRLSARAEKLADGTFRLALFKQLGCDDSLRVVIDVAPDGTIAERDSKKTGVALGCP
jgi:hypothetical protein